MEPYREAFEEAESPFVTQPEVTETEGEVQESEAWESAAEQLTAAEPETARQARASGFLKDVAELRTAPLAPTSPIAIGRGWPAPRRAAARLYNRLGGLMGVIATRLGVELPATLAVWRVESGGAVHTPGRAIIRFENHLLFKLWGRQNTAVYDQHFRYGGRGGQPGRIWENHQFRADPQAAFVTMHRAGNQGDEYRALQLAIRLAGEAIALQCISIGGPQILIASYRDIGYATPKQMYDAFQASERWHVIGFFDFCRTKRAPAVGQLIASLRGRNWADFAKYYNGGGQVAAYSGYLRAAYQAAQDILAQPARETESGEQESAAAEMEWERDPVSESSEAFEAELESEET
jgi:N-acetylmuramidase-like protein